MHQNFPKLTRREALRLSTGAIALATLGCHASAATAPAAARGRPPGRRPNIVMLVADDHRHSAIGALGESLVRTPVLDRLAADGTAFTRAHDMSGCNGAVCVPTRACLMTGCHVFHALADLRRNTIASDRVTLGQHLQRAGYRTVAVGKWHNDTASFNRSFADGRGIFLGGMSDHLKIAVQDYDATGAYAKSRAYLAPKFSTDFFCDTAAELIRAHRGDAPLFLYTAFTSPHDPRTPPQKFADLYDPEKIPTPPNYADAHPFDNGELKVRDELLAPSPRTPARMRREIADYYGMISHLDAGVGRILAALAETGLADNTIVVYTADHGLAVGQHGLLGKQNLYDHSVRVPLLLRGPGIPASRRHDALAYSWDIFPTLCDLAGVAAPAGVDAQSFAPVVRGERTTHRTELHALYRDFQRMVKDDRWKLIEYSVNGARQTQLFDLAADAWETRNLAADPAHAATVRRLRDRIAAWQRATGDTFALPA